MFQVLASALSERIGRHMVIKDPHKTNMQSGGGYTLKEKL